MGNLCLTLRNLCRFGEEINLSGIILTPEVLLNTCEGSWDRNRANQKLWLETIGWDKNEKLQVPWMAQKMEK